MRLLTAGSLVRAQQGEPSKIDEMAIYLKTLEIQGFFRIFGAKNIFGFYGCKIPTSETRTSDLLPKMRANNW
jgi:hypothetical protein